MKTKIIGILNVTPDSFSDGGSYLDPEHAQEAALRLREEGADLIDVGAVSTRPGATPVSASEEVRRLKPALEAICREVNPTMLSVDSGSPEASRLALSCGVRMLNLCGGFIGDPMLIREIMAHNASAIVYPSHGMSRESGILESRRLFFRGHIDYANAAGVPPDRLLLDPGIGFGMDSQGAVLLLRHLWEFAAFQRPLVIGVSRKRHLAVLLGEDPGVYPTGERMEAGLAAAASAVLQGASFIRTHDVRATKRFFSAFDLLQFT